MHKPQTIKRIKSHQGTIQSKPFWGFSNTFILFFNTEHLISERHPTLSLTDVTELKHVSGEIERRKYEDGFFACFFQTRMASTTWKEKLLNPT